MKPLGRCTTTEGLRAGLFTHTMGATTTRFDQGILFARHMAPDVLRATRLQAGIPWTGWLQSIDTAGMTHKSTSSADIHVTRSVLDLADRITEVWDARGLASATWTFAYDHAGRRLGSNHTTALGQRYSLPDAVGNPIWDIDARGIEADRVFDTLNRPLTEHSDDGSGAKLRRKWTYVDYDSGHPDLSDWQAKNLCGRVEEERDADGLRYFEYDWRGLVTRTSHRFWSVKDGSSRDWDDATSDFWTEGDAWDPEIPVTDRTSITDWLELDDLTDTTTVEVTTTYDAAGRPTEVAWPEGWTARSSYNEAGVLAGIEVDPGTGTYGDVLTKVTYNARGQVTGYTHGNGVETIFEHDEDLERLVRIFTQKPSPTTVHFQDLSYAYDPAGNPVRITDELAESSYRSNQLIPNSRTFTYDPRYRLIRATGKKHATVVDRTADVLVPSPDPKDYEPYTFRYTYDEVGNFTTNQEYRSGTQNLYYKAGRIDLFNGDLGEAGSFTDPTTGNFTYDENGNTLHTPRINALAYTFDNQVRYVDLGGGGTIRYLRHGDQRVLRFVNKTGVRALGIYLGPWEYHRRVGTTAYTKTVLHVEGHGRHAQMEEVLAGSDSTSLPIFYHHGDHLKSGHVLTKADGTLLSQEEYFPYGRPSDRRDARNRYRFIGVERDEDTGLCMTGPRTFDPVCGRFLQGDPVAAAIPQWSPFCYSSGSPVQRLDGSGYQDTVPLGASTSSAQGALLTKAQAESTLKPLDQALSNEGLLDTLGVTMEERQELEDVSELMKKAADEGRITVKDRDARDGSSRRVGGYNFETDTFVFYGPPELEFLVHEGTHALQKVTETDAVRAARLGRQENAHPLVAVAGMAAEVRLEAQAQRVEGIATAIRRNDSAGLLAARDDPFSLEHGVNSASIAKARLENYLRMEDIFQGKNVDIGGFMSSVPAYAIHGTPLHWHALVPPK